MPKVIVKSHLVHEGHIVEPNDEIKLTQDQIDHLGEKVEQVESDEKSFSEMNVEELKTVAEKQGIEGFNKLKKDELVEAIQASEQE